MTSRVPALFCSYILLPAVVGGLTGLVVGSIGWLVEDTFLDMLAAQDSAWLILLPLCMLPLTYIVTKHTFGLGKPATAEIYIDAYFSKDKKLPLREIPGRMLAAIASVGCGASQGLESPSNLVGAGIGRKIELLCKPLFAKASTRGMLMTAGSSAGIAAIFSSPFVGAFYGLEVPYRNGINLRFLVPAFVAAFSAYAFDWWVRGVRPLVTIAEGNWNNAPAILAVLAVALLCGFGARIFCILIRQGKNLAHRQNPIHRMAYATTGVLILATLSFFIIGQWVSYGPGYIATSWAFSGNPSIWLILLVFLLHTLGTILCVYGGAAGGVFTSLALAGTLIGLFVGTALGFPHGGLLPLVGAGCFLSAGYRIPFAGLALILTQHFSLLTLLIGAIAIAIAYWAIGNETVADASQ